MGTASIGNGCNRSRRLLWIRRWEWEFFRKIRWKDLIPRGVWGKAGLDAHHLIEQRFAKRAFGRKLGNVPAVVLDREFHQQEVTARLFRKLPTNRAKFEPQEIWNAYKDAYGTSGHKDWLEAIWPYFARLGVQR
jgi:hypothetical protein